VGGSWKRTKTLGMKGWAELSRAGFDNGITFWDAADKYGTHPHVKEALQTVKRETNPAYYRVIEQFGQAIGVPVLRNTRFNLRGKPAVDTPANALATCPPRGLATRVRGNPGGENRDNQYFRYCGWKTQGMGWPNLGRNWRRGDTPWNRRSRSMKSATKRTLRSTEFPIPPPIHAGICRNRDRYTAVRRSVRPNGCYSLDCVTMAPIAIFFNRAFRGLTPEFLGICANINLQLAERINDVHGSGEQSFQPVRFHEVGGEIADIHLLQFHFNTVGI